MTAGKSAAGKAGTGKTAFFKALRAAKLSCCEIYDITEESKQCVDWILQDQREYYNDREIVIDDIGRESPKIDYGERTEVLDLIMSYREKHCPYVRTHFVTNLTKAELAARYGDRVLSRMRYCKPIPFLDEDKRCARRFNVHPFSTLELPEPPQNSLDETAAEGGAKKITAAVSAYLGGCLRNLSYSSQTALTSDEKAIC